MHLCIHMNAQMDMYMEDRASLGVILRKAIHLLWDSSLTVLELTDRAVMVASKA